MMFEERVARLKERATAPKADIGIDAKCRKRMNEPGALGASDGFLWRSPFAHARQTARKGTAYTDASVRSRSARIAPRPVD